MVYWDPRLKGEGIKGINACSTFQKKDQAKVTNKQLSIKHIRFCITINNKQLDITALN